MKTFYTILKVLAVVAAVAGIVYIVATYGDKIVAWTRKLLHGNKHHECDGECGCCDCDCESLHVFAEDNAPVLADEDFED